MSAFSGFTPKASQFLFELGRRQDRDWFKANKADFDALLQQPMEGLVAALQGAVQKTYPHAAGGTPKVFRIYRDTRFSKDKTPFKTSMTAIVPVGAGTGGADACTGLYVEFGKQVNAGGGRFHFDPDELARFRAFVADDQRGAAFQKALDALVKKGYGLHSFEPLKRVPKPWEQSHPRAALLKLKGFGLSFPQLPATKTKGAGLVTHLAAQAKAAAPVLLMMDAAVSGQGAKKKG